MIGYIIFLLMASTVVSRPLASSAAAPAPSDALPEWAVVSTKHPWAIENNRKLMANANAKGVPLDFVLYGDSITWYHVYQTNASFNKYFGKYNSLAMGIGGDTVENLTYRMMVTEKPALPPKNIAIMIGTNNRDLTKLSDLFAHLEFLLTWLKRTFPTTNIVLLAVTPEKLGWGWAQKNQEYAVIAARTGVTFAQCGLNIDPNNTALMPDGLHPNAAGYDILLPCIAKAVGIPVAGQPTTVTAWRNLLLATGWVQLSDGKWTNPTYTCAIRRGLPECAQVTFYNLGNDPAYKSCIACVPK
ncbi:hypothetical protein ATCVGM07011_863R [Acanthocystis turfacea Chlorella virus GM0701.1]|nr:hypothetical protein ATCVGM07011_863R [Acanthocystis turfacea Chlorella virus GM0701.1]